MRGRAFFSLLLCLVCARSNASAETGPFANVNSAALAARDPQLVRDGAAAGLGTRYRLRDAGASRVTGYVGSEKPVVGRLAHGPWVALVALDTGGTIGAAAWLAYVGHRPAHVAALVAGTDASVARDSVAIRSKVYDPDAPDCCPRHVRVTTYAYRDGGFRRVASTVVPAPKPAQRTSRRRDAARNALAGSWVARCFPDFAYAFGSGADTPKIPRATPTHRFDTGVWQSGWHTGTFPPFLSPLPGSSRLAERYDATRRTLVFAHLGDEDTFAGFVTRIDGGAFHQRFDATAASNAGEPGVLRISAAPPRPGYAELIARLGPPHAIERACGMREVTYAAPGDAAPVIFAIYGPEDAPRAIGVQRSS